MVSFTGALCWAGNANPSLCPRVSYGNDWHCINSIPCVMNPVEAIVTTPAPSKALVTFRVGLQTQAVSPAGVHVAGSFQGWDPAATELLDMDNDGTYEVTLALSPGFYEFKFINGDSWDHVESVPSDCQEAGSGHSNRYLSVSMDSPSKSLHVCFAGCEPCPDAVTTVTTTTLPLSTTIETTVTVTDPPTTTNSVLPEYEFVPVDGGSGRACRGGSPSDNLAHHYTILSDIANLSECKARCRVATACVGVEYSAGRCEVWKRNGGIQASISLTGFVCLGYVLITPTIPTTTPVPRFEAVDAWPCF